MKRCQAGVLFTRGTGGPVYQPVQNTTDVHR